MGIIWDHCARWSDGIWPFNATGGAEAELELLKKGRQNSTRTFGTLWNVSYDLSMGAIHEKHWKTSCSSMIASACPNNWHANGGFKMESESSHISSRQCQTWRKSCQTSWSYCQFSPWRSGLSQFIHVHPISKFFASNHQWDNQTIPNYTSNQGPQGPPSKPPSHAMVVPRILDVTSMVEAFSNLDAVETDSFLK
jgi:hypothetical protein